MITETGAFQLEPFLETERRKVEAALERVLHGLLPSVPTDLREPVNHGVLGGGKRLRPVLCATVFSACRGEPVRDDVDAGLIYDLAVCVELIHAYSLMHDDLPCMDDAALRRGSSTPHVLFGEGRTARAAMALIPLAGLQAWAASERLGLSPADRRGVVEMLSKASGASGMVGGQALDLLAEGRSLSRGELDRLHQKKTGALLTASAVLGAVAAGADEEVKGAVGRYGDVLGLAFQIVDDVLDVTADAKTLGKHPSDQDLGKSTYVGLLGVEGARREATLLIRSGIEDIRNAGIRSAPLEALATYVVRRER